MRITFFLVIIFFACGCKQDLKESMLTKINIFERNESKYFKNTGLQALRNAQKQKPLAFQMMRKGVFGKATIEVSPDHIIHRNFPHEKDSIQLDVLYVIDSLKIRGLYNFGDSTQLEFWYKNDYVILYRENPYIRIETFEHSVPQSLVRNWNYFTFKLISN